MNKFITKLIVLVFLATPAVGFARDLCGGGTIQSFRDYTAGQDGVFSFAVKFSSQNPQRGILPNGEFSVNTTSDSNSARNTRLREVVIAAFASGSFVKLAAGSVNSCSNPTEVWVCSNETNCE